MCNNIAITYEVEKFGDREFNRVLETFENHNVTIINYFEQRLTNASAESFNTKIKAFRTQFRGGDRHQVLHVQTCKAIVLTMQAPPTRFIR